MRHNRKTSCSSASRGLGSGTKARAQPAVPASLPENSLKEYSTRGIGTQSYSTMDKRFSVALYLAVLRCSLGLFSVERDSIR